MSQRMVALFLFLLITHGVPVAAVEQSLDVGLEHNHFWYEPAFPEQLQHAQTSVSIQPEWIWTVYDDVQMELELFYRWDAQDDERTHGDIRELYGYYQANYWDVLVGISKVFWGVAESRHLVDVINQTDLLEDIDQEDKLGQPMININGLYEWGQLSLFVLPRFRERAFPGPQGRFRPGLPIEQSSAVYESSQGDQHSDWAIRYSHVLGNWDIGVAYFDGTSREPRFLLAEDEMSLLPVYDLMEQVGIDAQYTGESWLLKWEAIDRKTQIDHFMASVAGFEYTFYQILGSYADLGVLFEYLSDARNQWSPPTAFDDDIFLAMRYVQNDVQDTQVLAGIFLDVEHQQTQLSVEAERRLGDRFLLEIVMRFSFNEAEEDPLFFAAQDDFLRFRLHTYF